MNKTMHKQIHFGMAVMLLLALTNGLLNPFAVGGRTDGPADITMAEPLGQGQLNGTSSLSKEGRRLPGQAASYVLEAFSLLAEQASSA